MREGGGREGEGVREGGGGRGREGEGLREGGGGREGEEGNMPKLGHMQHQRQAYQELTVTTLNVPVEQQCSSHSDMHKYTHSGCGL